jgi:hypothetical protein
VAKKLGSIRSLTHIECEETACKIKKRIKKNKTDRERKITKIPYYDRSIYKREANKLD